MKTYLIAAIALGSVMVTAAAETPAPTSTTNAPAATAKVEQRKVHSGCHLKRPGQHGGGVGIKHHCQKKSTNEAPKK